MTVCHLAVSGSHGCLATFAFNFDDDPPGKTDEVIETASLPTQALSVIPVCHFTVEDVNSQFVEIHKHSRVVAFKLSPNIADNPTTETEQSTEKHILYYHEDDVTAAFVLCCDTLQNKKSSDNKNLPVNQSNLGELLTSGHDLVQGVLEGGFTLWQGSQCLVRYLEEHVQRPDSSCWQGKSVLELGCGAGLPGLWALLYSGANQVTFQDFNADVLRFWTAPNVLLNYSSKVPSKCTTGMENVHFVSGDWRQCFSTDRTEKLLYDVILSSETMYRRDHYSTFCDICENFLRPGDGVAWLEMKSVFLDTGGSAQEFVNYVRRQRGTLLEVADMITLPFARETQLGGVVRVVLRIRRLLN